MYCSAVSTSPCCFAFQCSPKIACRVLGEPSTMTWFNCCHVLCVGSGSKRILRDCVHAQCTSILILIIILIMTMIILILSLSIILTMMMIIVIIIIVDVILIVIIILIIILVIIVSIISIIMFVSMCIET